MDKMRKAFEEWLHDSGEITHSAIQLKPSEANPMHYEEWETDLAWCAWQAALQSQQPAWIPCAERLPTEADEDYDRVVWATTNTGLIERVQARVVCIPFESFSYTHWMPTNLTRPAPPEVE